MTPEQARQLVHFLEQAKIRPGLFFPLDESGLQGFLAGIHTAQLAFFGPFPPLSVTDAILQERGWSVPNALGPWLEMKARGYDFSILLDEILTVEIETLRRTYNLSTVS